MLRGGWEGEGYDEKGRGGGGWGVRWERDPSRSYAVSAPAVQEASQLILLIPYH